MTPFSNSLSPGREGQGEGDTTIYGVVTIFQLRQGCFLKGLYYFTKKVVHFSQSKSIFEKLFGKVIITWEFPITFFYFLFRYGPFREKIMKKGLKHLDKVVKGIILCHSADDSVPPGKNYQRVFVYHGTSDKVFDFPDGKLDAGLFDYYFFTGPKDMYKLKNFTHNSEGLEARAVKIGMFRSDPLFNKSYEREEILENYRINPGSRKIVLYAPTWRWGGGTLDRCFETFAKEITKKYVLIIRPHYNDGKNYRPVLKWQKKHRQKHLYIFYKQHQEIMDFICISDLMIGDNSAVNYDFALTKRPMVFVKSEGKDVFIPPDEYNIKLCGPVYDPDNDDILEKIEEAFSNPVWVKRISRLIEKSFYHNDGHAVDRACSFIIDRLSEKGIIDRDRILKKYRNTFTYIDNYT